MLGTCKMSIIIGRAERKGSVVLRLLGGWCFLFSVGELSAVPLLAPSGTLCDRLCQRASTCVWTTNTSPKRYSCKYKMSGKFSVLYIYLSSCVLFLLFYTNGFLQHIQRNNSGSIKLIEVKGKCGGMTQPLASVASKAGSKL